MSYWRKEARPVRLESFSPRPTMRRTEVVALKVDRATTHKARFIASPASPATCDLSTLENPSKVLSLAIWHSRLRHHNMQARSEAFTELDMESLRPTSVLCKTLCCWPCSQTTLSFARDHDAFQIVPFNVFQHHPLIIQNASSPASLS